MANRQPQEVTIEEIAEDPVGPYELVRWEVQGRYIVVVVRENPLARTAAK